MREVARVLRPGGRWVFSATHPMRWAFPDDPGRAGLTRRARRTSTARRTSSRTTTGQATYVEHHRTLGDRVRELVAAGLRLRRPGRAGVAGGATTETWGGWCPLRGRLIPGTAIFVCRRD